MDSSFTQNAAGDRLTDLLPQFIKEETIEFTSKTRTGADLITELVDKCCEPNHYVDVKKSLKKEFILGKFKLKPSGSGSDVIPRATKGHLSLRDKRRLGLYKLPRSGLRYSQFTELHEIWRQYMLDSLDFPQFAAKKGLVNVTDKNWEYLSSQLYKADYHGAKVRVVRSKCPSYVGVEGIVVMDTKNTFRILSKDNTVRTIAKESSVFQVQIDKYQLTVFGHHLCIKPAERSTKKIRTNINTDL